LAENVGGSPGWAQQTERRPQDGGLAPAARADQPVYLAWRNGEVEISEDVAARVGQMESIQHDRWRAPALPRRLGGAALLDGDAHAYSPWAGASARCGSQNAIGVPAARQLSGG